MNEDRIKLAEAMGWKWREDFRWVRPDGSLDKPLLLPTNKTNISFDPFTDANDDYAVLEWMRGGCLARLEDFKDAIAAASTNDSGYKAYLWRYQIGDYARAALRVIDDE